MTSIDMLEQIKNLLPPSHSWGQNLICLDTVDSTNNYAKRLARQGAPAGTVIIAQSQSSGRGRMGRSFCSPDGQGLYLSVILRPGCQPSQIMHLTCATAVAACNAIVESGNIACGIKWTNDLVISQKKLGGILTELSIDPGTRLVDYAIVGIGINCLQKSGDFPAEIADIATSLSICGGNADRAALAAALIKNLAQMSDTLISSKKAMMAIYRSLCVTVGQQISVFRADQVFHARAISVDDDGGLVIEHSDGTPETVTSGEVSIRGMYGYL